jgi:hypothetical protein
VPGSDAGRARSRCHIGLLRPLAEIGREGGGTLEELSTLGGRARAKARCFFFGVARRVAPAWTFQRTVNDPNVTWWHREPGLRKWAWDLIAGSDALKELFAPGALSRLVQRDSMRGFRVARSAIWTLLTIAGMERTLREGGRRGD